MTSTSSNAFDIACDTSVALTDAELDAVSGTGVGQKIFGIALTAAGVLTTVAGVAGRQWGVAGRGTNMILDGIGNIEAA
ncbi:MAG: hypothetical protein GY873_17530 [Bosea sp.]|uniref:hypothetical protein n=1 Tax=Bosea sp. (in: a-proteobacteria) TaxID=1871050 RepID=UPI0023880D97|nr:hypothetical protein [Bosea sp. (in: a-proteobacteria)]MCP4735990.1 hypothetical protein [Bosea sp. (in: a-proteobacteria)]